MSTTTPAILESQQSSHGRLWSSTVRAGQINGRYMQILLAKMVSGAHTLVLNIKTADT